jgi:hypothetical protein
MTSHVLTAGVPGSIRRLRLRLRRKRITSPKEGTDRLNQSTRLSFTLALFLGLQASALADYVIEERMEHNGVPAQNVTIKLKAGKARCDMGTSMSTIATEDGITLLMHDQKMAMKMPAGLGAAASKKDLAAAAKSELKATGRKEKISGFDTEEYVHENSNLKATTHLWIAKDFPDRAEIMKLLAALQGPLTKQLIQATGSVATEDYPGLPIRSEIESKLLGKDSRTVLTILSLKKEAVDDSAFVVPSDYRSSGPGGH